MKKGFLKKIAAVTLAAGMAVGLIPAMGYLSNEKIGVETAYASDDAMWSAFDIEMSPRTTVSAGKKVTFDICIKNLKNQTITADMYPWYYREFGNSEKYPGIEFGTISGKGYSNGSITIGANKQLDLTLTGTIPASWNEKSTITIVLDAYDDGFMGQADYPSYDVVEFSDVTDPEAFYYEPVYWASDVGITTGWPDGTFRPWDACNRAAVVTFLWRMEGCPEVTDKADFRDMTGNPEFDAAISWAVAEGITTGWSDNTFRPWRTCNRAAIATFLWRYAGKPVASKSKFKDMTGNSDFDKAITWVSEEGIANGWSDGTFRPWNNCNRASVVSFLYRY